ncbi:MAG: DUF2249 domain-containing protein [Candidatus Eremiobacteraeota bacterium]|nr:DUF2249 domain-containing protein [Candidatus Eremiobacteraeota bacterium]
MTSKPLRSARLDVRPLPTWERHPRIERAFDALAEGEALTVVTDHEPRPLRLGFEQKYPERFVWLQRQLGIARWEVELRRTSRAEPLGSLAAFLRRCPLLCDASDATHRALEKSATEKTLDEGTPAVEQDARWPYLGLVRAGTLAAIMGSPTGRDQSLYDVLPCETFGDIETLDGGRSVARIIATSAPARVVLLPAGIVVGTMTKDVAVARALAAIAAQRTRALAERLSDLSAQPAIARVALAILPFAAPDAGLAPSLEPLRRMTQAQLATIAGTAKEVAARAVAHLEASGAVERARGRIARVDRRKLQEFLS